ncbi:hypothetical protein TNCV_4350011 [Trichonephila clavipes]|nr:hypothetical protein TNCV_4350011 [Trichonephila clavipes]
MFQARRLLQQQFPTEPSIPQQELLLQQLIMSPSPGRRRIHSVSLIMESGIKFVVYCSDLYERIIVFVALYPTKPVFQKRIRYILGHHSKICH